MATELTRRAYRLGHWLCRRLSVTLFRYEAAPLPPLEGPLLILANHAFDMDFMALMANFPQPMHFVIGEALFRLRWLLTLLRKLHDPIVIRKGGTDARAVLDILSRLRRGENVCLFPEGSTSFDGRSVPIPSGTGLLARASGATVVTFRVHGGYFTKPRWGYGLRRGRTWGEVAGVYPPGALKPLTDAQALERIQRDLEVDAAQDQQVSPIAYRGKRMAEGLPHLLYHCPACQRIGSLRAKGDVLRCTACPLCLRYTPYGRLEGEGGGELKDWAARQREALILLAQEPGFTLTDEGEQLSAVGEDHVRSPLAQGQLRLGREGLWVGDFRLPLSDIAGMAIFRKGRLLLSDRQGNHYEIESTVERSALKYLQLYSYLTEKG